MNGNNQDPTSVGIFSMMPGITQEGDGVHALSTMLSNNEQREEYQFNSLLIDSFLKQQQHNPTSSTSSPPDALQSTQIPADGIVPDVIQGLNNKPAYHTPLPPIPVVQNPNPNIRKRKTEDGNPELPETESNFLGDDSRELTAEEKKTLKKQRRLVKNREAAQLFRQRQKEYISNLEMKAAELTTANTEANARVELLASENKLMKEQLVYLRNFMKQAVSYSFPYAATTMPIAQVPSSSTPSSPTQQPQLSPTMMSPLGANYVDVEAFHDIRLRGDMSSLGNNPSGIPTRPAVITTADGTSLNVNVGILGGVGGIPMTPFPMSLVPMPMMTPMMPSQNTSLSQQPSPPSIGIVPSRDDKDLMPD